MPTALQYMVKLKNIYKENYVNVLKKHFGFLPFDIIKKNNNKFITKDDFITADHPIMITTTPVKWSCGVIDCKVDINTYNLNKISDGSKLYGPPVWYPIRRRETHPFLIAIWNTVSYKGFATEKMYNKIILNLNKIFYIKNSEFVLLDKKYHQHFVHAISAFDIYKHI